MPELAVVVLSYGNEDTLVAAVDSVLVQEEEVELIVSHSGPSAAPDLLARERPGVRVIAAAEQLLPGAARNAGVAATRAPFVAFLSGDARARPGWAAARLARHRAGAMAVASAVVPVAGAALPAVAGCLLTHGYRLPGLSTPPWLRFGASYARAALERFGPFPEDRRIGEDDAVNTALLEAGLEIEAAPEVVTEQAYAESVSGMLAEQYARGRRRALAHDRPGRARLAVRALQEAPRGALRARRSPAIDGRRAGLYPLLAAGAAARALGSVLRRPPAQGVARRGRRLG